MLELQLLGDVADVWEATDHGLSGVEVLLVLIVQPHLHHTHVVLKNDNSDVVNYQCEIYVSLFIVQPHIHHMHVGLKNNNSDVINHHCRIYVGSFIIQPQIHCMHVFFLKTTNSSHIFERENMLQKYSSEWT